MQGHVENTRPLVPLTPQGPTRWGCEASRVRFGHRVRKAQLEEKPGSSRPAVASERPRPPPARVYTLSTVKGQRGELVLHPLIRLTSLRAKAPQLVFSSSWAGSSVQ